TFSREQVFTFAKNFTGRARNVYKVALRRVERGLQHSYVGRKEKKRTIRSLWIQRINAGCREHGFAYSALINGLNQENIQLNRKVLSELAMHEPDSFKAVLDQVRFMKGQEIYANVEP
uniref:bL20m n=1 Tax=Polytomella magna TaxID=353565 RepID=UPI002240E4D0|nr:Chain Ao, bL20m [Polytomella magna]8APN_Ao Chain Ao, bL20m [Polytomella magna]8APO_Ao Chain Ao, bL20m [Polytomella magna]